MAIRRMNHLAPCAAALMTAAFLAAAPARADEATDILTYKGPDRAKKIEEGARKEGSLMWYTALTVNQGLRAEVDAFVKKYPFMKVDSWRGTETQIIQKTLAEQRANNHQVGVLER